MTAFGSDELSFKANVSAKACDCASVSSSKLFVLAESCVNSSLNCGLNVVRIIPAIPVNSMSVNRRGALTLKLKLRIAKRLLSALRADAVWFDNNCV